MSAPLEVTREEMARILAEHCPTASEMVRHAALTGSTLKLADGRAFRAPDTFDYTQPSPCRLPAVVTKVGPRCVLPN